MKFTDVIARTIKVNGVTSVFGLQGGAVVHIFDSLENIEVPVVYTHHESTASFAASANAKASRNLGCVVVTSGPGATNALTGLLGAWQDSVPCLFLSGQVRSSHMSYGKKVRQVGTQEVNIVDIVRPITKYSKTISQPDDIQEEMNKSIEIALSDRPGPVWLDLPLEYQWSDVIFDQKKLGKIKPRSRKYIIEEKLKTFIKLLNEARTPLFVLGYGVFLAGCEDLVREFIRNNDFRCVTTWTAGGIFSSNSKFNLGIIGMSGQAGANKAIFNTDIIISLGTHLSIPHTTTLTDQYAPLAKKVFINIDKDQLDNLNLKSDLNILSDLNYFMEKISEYSFSRKQYKKLDKFKALNWKKPVLRKTFVDPNLFFRSLTKLTTDKDAIIVDGGGTALYTGFQSSVLEENQRIICASGISSMGTGLADTIGTFMSKKFRELYTIIGDGSALMNIQDLQSIKDLNIPVVICIINNNGYLAIRHTQQGFLENRLYGTHPEWSLGIVNFKKAAKAFDIRYICLEENSDIDDVCKEAINSKGPLIIEVKTPEDQAVLFSQRYQKNKDGTSTPLSLEFMK